ncbi:hypothetical protein CORC01_00434 [Colletotrichum orchidophilum]|uniref:Uncharacterized protein n=1 Tax=Colletotrichum orchidophilum TaxID=1209926 RepID=A0A1G4BS05_9PEZI|nr:uncharacterized protein CORC01_00434 [Colletotrichum orchidophilum]OHF04095.1 hypothetical protein CORC01_00434 [Colletotrichum orchidophilum]
MSTIHTRHVDPVLQYRDIISQGQLDSWSDQATRPPHCLVFFVAL